MKNTKYRAGIALIAVFAAVTALPLAAQSEIIKLEAIASYYGDEFQGRPTSSGELFDMNALTAAHKTLPFGTMLEITNLANGKKVVVRVNDRGPFVDTRELDVSKAAAAQLGMLDTGTARVSIRKIAGLDAAAVGAANSPAPAPAASPTVTPASAPEPIATEPVMVVTATQPNAQPNAHPAQIAQPTQIVQPATTNQAAPTTQPAQPVTAVPAATTAPAAPAISSVSVAASPAAVHTVANPVLGATSTGLSWRIQLGSFSNEENANKLVIRLRKDGFNPAFEKSGALTRVVIAGVPDRELAATRSRLDSAGYGQYLVRQESW